MALSDLQKYQMLNSVIPYFNKTLYPYNKITDDKIIETQKEITLVYQHENMFFPEILYQNKTKKGGSTHRPVKKITVLLYDIESDGDTSFTAHQRLIGELPR